MEIKRVGSQPSTKGPPEWFTGAVRIHPLFQANDPARSVGASVTFEPGARTAWHTHPLGQTLIITAGCGRVQREHGPVEEVYPATWFGFLRARSTGMARLSPRACRTSLSRSSLTAKRSIGWSRSATRNIGRNCKHQPFAPTPTSIRLRAKCHRPRFSRRRRPISGIADEQKY